MESADLGLQQQQQQQFPDPDKSSPDIPPPIPDRSDSVRPSGEDDSESQIPATIIDKRGTVDRQTPDTQPADVIDGGQRDTGASTVNAVTTVTTPTSQPSRQSPVTPSNDSSLDRISNTTNPNSNLLDPAIYPPANRTDLYPYPGDYMSGDGQNEYQYMSGTTELLNMSDGSDMHLQSYGQRTMHEIDPRQFHPAHYGPPDTRHMSHMMSGSNNQMQHRQMPGTEQEMQHMMMMKMHHPSEQMSQYHNNHSPYNGYPTNHQLSPYHTTHHSTPATPPPTTKPPSTFKPYRMTPPPTPHLQPPPPPTAIPAHPGGHQSDLDTCSSSNSLSAYDDSQSNSDLRSGGIPSAITEPPARNHPSSMSSSPASLSDQMGGQTMLGNSGTVGGNSNTTSGQLGLIGKLDMSPPPSSGGHTNDGSDPYGFVDDYTAERLQYHSPVAYSTMGTVMQDGTDGPVTPTVVKKRGRKKKSDAIGDIDDGCPPTAIASQKITNNNNNGTVIKERKKHDRFNGMSEEEVSKRTLPDHLAMNLDIIIIGINPGLFAAYKGHHYAGPGNHFWKCLYLSGLTHQQMSADDDNRLLEIGIGFTNMVQRATKGSADLTRKEIKDGCTLLQDKLKHYRPKIAVFNGKLIFEVFSGKKDFNFGRQPECIEGTNTYMWVMPSSSARCAQLPRAADKVPFYAALKKFRDYLNGLIPHMDESETIFNDPKYKTCYETEPATPKTPSTDMGAGPADGFSFQESPASGNYTDLMDIGGGMMSTSVGEADVPGKKKRGRPKKVKYENGPDGEMKNVPRRPAISNQNDSDGKKKRGRPKKVKGGPVIDSSNGRQESSPVPLPSMYRNETTSAVPTYSQPSDGSIQPNPGYTSMAPHPQRIQQYLPQQHYPQPGTGQMMRHPGMSPYSARDVDMSAGDTDPVASPVQKPTEYDHLPNDSEANRRAEFSVEPPISSYQPYQSSAYRSESDAYMHHQPSYQNRTVEPARVLHEMNTYKLPDVAAKSLSGLESLVEQIPSLSEENSPGGSHLTNSLNVANLTSSGESDTAGNCPNSAAQSIDYDPAIYSSYSQGNITTSTAQSVATTSTIHSGHYGNGGGAFSPPASSAGGPLSSPFSVSSLTASNYQPTAMNSYHSNLMAAAAAAAINPQWDGGTGSGPGTGQPPPPPPPHIPLPMYHPHHPHIGHPTYHPAYQNYGGGPGTSSSGSGPPVHMPSPNYPYGYAAAAAAAAAVTGYGHQSGAHPAAAAAAAAAAGYLSNHHSMMFDRIKPDIGFGGF